VRTLHQPEAALEAEVVGPGQTQQIVGKLVVPVNALWRFGYALIVGDHQGGVLAMKFGGLLVADHVTAEERFEGNLCGRRQRSLHDDRKFLADRDFRKGATRGADLVVVALEEVVDLFFGPLGQRDVLILTLVAGLLALGANPGVLARGELRAFGVEVARFVGLGHGPSTREPALDFHEANLVSLSFDFTGRTAIVTSAAQGMGFELCWMLAEAGAKVVPTDRDARGLKSTWGSTSEFVLPLTFDPGEPESSLEVVAACTEWGGLDILVNFADFPEKDAAAKADRDNMNAARLRGVTNLTKAALPSMKARGFGRIVNFTTVAGIPRNVDQEITVAADDGVISFTKSLAKEVARCGITVNAVATIAEMTLADTYSEEMKSELLSKLPLGHFANPSEISSAVGFLASDEASYITGIVLPIDGGVSI
jgi:3-oxoacyl-[acyl-carrier protein] reductase